MARITLDCPHCGDRRCGFNTCAIELMPGKILTFSGAAQCTNPGCQKFIAFEAEARSHNKFTRMYEHQQIFGDMRLNQYFEKITVWPEPARASVLNFLPAKVEKAMKEADESRLVRHFRLARGAYRTVLDEATRDLVTSRRKQKLKLVERIDWLARERKITDSLRDWAHSIRTITNEDVHTVEDVSQEECEEAAEITRLLLVYLFEMPGRVAQARELAEEKKRASRAEVKSLPAPSAP